MALAKYYEDLLERQIESLNQIENSLNENLEHDDLIKIKNQLAGDLQVLRSLIDDFMELITNPENSEIVNLKNEIKRLQAICNEVDYNSYLDLREKYNKLKQENDRLNKEIIYQEGKIKHITNEQVKSKNDIDKMSCKIKSLNDEILSFNKIKNEYKQLKIEIKNKNDEINMLYDEVEKIEKMLELSRNPKDIKEISLLRKENYKLLEKLKNLSEEYSIEYQEKNRNLIKSNSVYVLELKNKDLIIKKLEKSIESYNKNISHLKNENNNKSKTISKLNNVICQLEKDVINRNDEKLEQISKLSKEISKLNKVIMKLKQDIVVQELKQDNIKDGKPRIFRVNKMGG